MLLDPPDAMLDACVKDAAADNRPVVLADGLAQIVNAPS